MEQIDKILFIGDIHIKFNNLKEVEMLEQFIRSSETLSAKISFIVIAGDVLDTHEKINIQLLNRAYNFIHVCRTKAPVYVLVGNHDYINNQQFLTSNHWMNGLKEWPNIHVIDKPVFFNSLKTGKPKYLFMPYVPVGRFIEALSTTADWKKCLCIFAHQEIKNCKMGPIQSIEGDKWELDWPMLISGHIHERQYVQKNVLYPGSVINHSFGSDNQGLSLFSFSENGPSVSEFETKVDIGLDKKSIIYKHLDSIGDIHLDTLTKNNKLSLEGEVKDIAAFKKSKIYKTLVDKQIKVVFRIKSVDDPDHQSTTPSAQSNGEKAITPFVNILSNLISKETDLELERDFQHIKDKPIK